METLTKENVQSKVEEKYKHIPGWGIDADKENDPTYPMKSWDGSDHKRLNYERAPQQQQNVELLKSVERPAITRVFGTSSPPKGLSGMLRRFAFKFSEGSSGHWLTLILADRINVIEGLVDDLSKGHVPNIVKERGWTAEWKYNRKAVVKSLAIGAGISAALLAYLIYTRSNRRLQQSRT